MPAWLVFLLSGAAFVLAGMRLARDGDAIAERTGRWAPIALGLTYLSGMRLLHLNRSERRRWYIEPDAALRILTYATGLYLVYRVGGG